MKFTPLKQTMNVKGMNKMELLKELTQTHSVSGNENHIYDIIIRELCDAVDEIYTDEIGNLVAHKKGGGKKLLISAHIDEIGLMANFIDSDGFVRFSGVGEVNFSAILYNRVKFNSGVTGIVCPEANLDSKKEVRAKDMYIDIGTSSCEETKSLISPGDVAALCSVFQKRDKRIFSGSLDNKAGVYALIKSIQTIRDNSLDLYFVFSSQEELGSRGAKIAAYNINPDIALSVDVTAAEDIPGGDNSQIQLGKGVAIKFMDKSVITHKGFRDTIIRIAEDNEISHQFEIVSKKLSDSGAIQSVKNGVVTGAISIPARYIHTECEMIDEDDIDACINLICEICKKDFILF